LLVLVLVFVLVFMLATARRIAMSHIFIIAFFDFFALIRLGLTPKYFG